MNVHDRTLYSFTEENIPLMGQTADMIFKKQ